MPLRCRRCKGPLTRAPQKWWHALWTLLTARLAYRCGFCGWYGWRWPPLFTRHVDLRK